MFQLDEALAESQHTRRAGGQEYFAHRHLSGQAEGVGFRCAAGHDNLPQVGLDSVQHGLSGRRIRAEATVQRKDVGAASYT
ncbi:hypothetical protein D3C81_1786580 [compost metagenome]